MNPRMLALSFAALLALAPVLAKADVLAAQSFNQLKALTGTWTGTNSAGESLTVSFRETSAGSALLSEVHVGKAAAEDGLARLSGRPDDHL